MLKLHEEQGYIFECARKLGAEIKLLKHPRPTNTCAEKLRLLHENPDFSDWTLDRSVKALYFGRSNQPLIGVVIPELERDVDTKDLFYSKIKLLNSRGEAERYWPNPKYVPKGMSWGTCSPFPLASSVGQDIRDIIVVDYLPIKYKTVDISVGGESEEMHEVSMHLPYGAIYDILSLQFGKRIHLSRLT